MKRKDPGYIRRTLLYLFWGLIGMLSVLVLLFIAAAVGWG